MNDSLIEILYEDKDVLAVNKPAGLLVHRDGKTAEKTLCDILLKMYPDMKEVGEPLILSSGEKILRPGIVHRIDRETSGVLLVAKTPKGFDLLKKQFQERKIGKTYYAFVYGILRPAHGKIDLPLGRSKGDFRQYAHPPRARGELREALTYYETEKKEKEYSFVKLIPKTGRTHQLRAHLKAVGHPIVSDKIYASGRESASTQDGPALGFLRLALHAAALTFRNSSDETVTVKAPYPADFEKALKGFGE